MSERPKLDYETPKAREPHDLLADMAVWVLGTVGIATVALLGVGAAALIFIGY